MGNSASADGGGDASQGQGQLPPYAATTGVVDASVDNTAKKNAAQGRTAAGVGAFPSSSAAAAAVSAYVPIDEEIAIPVAVAVPAPEDGSYNPSYQQHQQQQQYPRAPDPVSATSAQPFVKQTRSTGSPAPPVSSSGAIVAQVQPIHTATTPASLNQMPQYQQQQEQPQVMMLYLKRRPTLMEQCPMCLRSNVRTRTSTAPNYITWLSVVGLLFVFWPICWIPLVIDQTKQTDHYCASCQQYIGNIQPYQDCCVRHRGRQGRGGWWRRG